MTCYHEHCGAHFHPKRGIASWNLDGLHFADDFYLLLIRINPKEENSCHADFGLMCDQMQGEVWRSWL